MGKNHYPSHRIIGYRGGRVVAFCCALLILFYVARHKQPEQIVPPVIIEKQSFPLKIAHTKRTEASLASLYDELRKEAVKDQVIPPTVKKRVIIFTMDATYEYEKKAQRGGASGEITIRRSLENALIEFGADVQILHSDAEFSQKCCKSIDIIILDPWTWAAPGWVVKPQLRGFEDRVWLLDFFGADRPKNNGIKINKSNILTAYPTFPGNTFLGFAFDDQPGFIQTQIITEKKKKNQVVLWGKDPKHFIGRTPILKAIAKIVQLHATLPVGALRDKVPNLIYHGHLNKLQWHQLLAESKAVIGMGHPLLGPTGLDALAHGCVYVDPSYAPNTKGLKYPQYHSQHPYLRQYAINNTQFASYVCAAQLEDPASFVRCIQSAIKQTPDLKPHIPMDFRYENHRARVRNIFGSVLFPHDRI